jgi:hypothetical protein
MNNLIVRAKKPTPKFFKMLRNLGLSIAAIGATIIAAPVALPAVVIKIAGHLAVAGSVMSGVSQVTVKNEKQ